jgi:hypothetical protein
MSVGGRIDSKEDDGRPIEETQGHNDTLGEALKKAGFKPARVGRKTVSQGKRRETLKKTISKDPGA